MARDVDLVALNLVVAIVITSFLFWRYFIDEGSNKKTNHDVNQEKPHMVCEIKMKVND
ncbi:hypothetical protein K4P79_10570 [Staphylococcus epidermidis]|nr:hypothetical protein [Staphylococcus epidermidis]MCG2569270.1 hypothetical protein [Staphylococcus epidermidis]